MAGPSLQGPRRNNDPNELSEYARRLIELRRQMNDLTGSILKSAGIDVSPDGMTINSALDVLGSLDVSGPASFGGNTDISGTLAVTGNATFSGDLAVPNGSITNDALQNPLAYRAGIANNESLVIGTTEATVTQFTITVPAGFTSALVVASAQLGVFNSSAGILSAASRIYVSRPGFSTFSGRSWTDVPSGFDFGINTTWQDVMTVSGGDVLTYRLAVIGDAAWPGSTGFGTINGYALFTR